MKKLLVLLFFTVAAFSLNAERGDLKVGVAVGYPYVGVTASLTTGNSEWNGILGSDYNSFVLGVNSQFTIVEVPIGNLVFPISFGPQLLVIYRDWFALDGQITVRVEYTFDNIPLNLFVEGGGGVRFSFSNDPLRFSGSGMVGARWVF